MYLVINGWKKFRSRTWHAYATLQLFTWANLEMSADRSSNWAARHSQASEILVGSHVESVRYWSRGGGVHCLREKSTNWPEPNYWSSRWKYLRRSSFGRRWILDWSLVISKFAVACCLHGDRFPYLLFNLKDLLLFLFSCFFLWLSLFLPFLLFSTFLLPQWVYFVHPEYI